ncbi:tautomerase family protein [uncultured Meiothermus sp.]|jgi:4-oxalocrotonate tautomerase|uniref:tautomerase family protein n=1 Tax=uncultured Meiothermus sp. TaxID=157471 RepID=UPI00261375EC|nr:tautomerase family protein [uncultured Meiothermus sp.]
MAIVRVEIAKRPQEQRDAIIAGITEVLVQNGAKREGVQVLLYELEMTCWGRGGVTFDKIKKQQEAEAAALVKDEKKPSKRK